MGRCLSVALLGLLALMALRTPALGQSCTIPDYAGEADDRLAGVTECEEIDQFTIDTPVGTRRVRVIADGAIPAGFTEPFPLVREGIERAASALRTMGNGRVDDLIVVVSGLLPDPDASGGPTTVHGVANAPYADECLIIVYPGNSGAPDLGFATAHEFFHCVQYATATDQMAAFEVGQPSEWWVEGTAEWFANLAYQGATNSHGRVLGFDENSPEKPLTWLTDSDGAVVFFFWYGEKYGYSAMVPFMQSMATSGAWVEEMNELANELSPDEAQHLVQDYLDRQIRQPGGRGIPSEPREGQTFIFAEEHQTEEMRADRLTLHRAKLIFTCGTWTVQVSGENGKWAVSEGSGAWERLPLTIEVPPGEEKRYRLGAIGTADDGFTLTLTASREDREGRCRCEMPTPETVARLDQCLVGEWLLLSGGGHEWLDRQLSMIQQSSGTWDSYESETTEGNRILVIRRDGLYEYENATAARSVHATRKDKTYSSRIQGVSAGVGTWETKGGELITCAISETSSATAELVMDGNPMHVDLPGYISEHLYSGGYGYSCSDAALTLRFRDMGTLSEPMVWNYNRQK